MQIKNLLRILVITKENHFKNGLEMKGRNRNEKKRNTHNESKRRETKPVAHIAKLPHENIFVFFFSSFLLLFYCGVGLRKVCDWEWVLDICIAWKTTLETFWIRFGVKFTVGLIQFCYGKIWPYLNDKTVQYLWYSEAMKRRPNNKKKKKEPLIERGVNKKANLA